MTPSDELDRLHALIAKHGLSQMLNEKHPAFLPLRDILSGMESRWWDAALGVAPEQVGGVPSDGDR